MVVILHSNTGQYHQSNSQEWSRILINRSAQAWAKTWRGRDCYLRVVTSTSHTQRSRLPPNYHTRRDCRLRGRRTRVWVESYHEVPFGRQTQFPCYRLLETNRSQQWLENWRELSNENTHTPCAIWNPQQRGRGCI